MSRAFRWTWAEHLTSATSPASPTQRLVALVLAVHYMIGDDAEAWPSNATIAERTGLSPRAVRTALHGLRDLQLLVVAREGRGTSTRYRAVLPRHDVPTPPRHDVPTSDAEPRHLTTVTPAPRSQTPAPPAPDPRKRREGTEGAPTALASADAAAAPPDAPEPETEWCPFCGADHTSYAELVEHVEHEHRDRQPDRRPAGAGFPCIDCERCSDDLRVYTAGYASTGEAVSFRCGTCTVLLEAAE